MGNYSKASKIGSIRKLDSGKYLVRVSNGYKRDGKRNVLSGVCDTEREAEFMRMQFVILAGKMPNLGDDMTLDEYYNGFFVPGRKSHLANSTMQRYEQSYSCHIKPVFGYRGMSTIKHAEIQALIYTLPYYTAKHVAQTLRAILRSAWDDDLLDVEPMRHRLKFKANERPQRGVWSAETVMQAMPLMQGTPFEALWLLMIGAGLRREEAYALFWRDIAFERVTSITGDESYYCTAAIDDAVTLPDGRKCVKTAFSERVAVVAEPFAKRLHELKGAPEEPICKLSLHRVSRSWSNMWQKRPLKKDGTPYAADNPRYYKGRMLDAGIPYVQLSRMRATHETLIQSAGVVDTLNARLHGRSDASQVGYRNYLNPDLDAFRQAADAMSDELKRASNG